jgi:hypothetical protein
VTYAYVGGMSIGGALPGVTAALALAQPDLEGRVGAMLQFSPVVFNFAADIALLEGTMLSLKAAITAGVEPPSLDVQFDLMKLLLDELLQSLQAVLDFQNILTNAGVHVYTYTGVDGGLVPGGFPGGSGSDNCNAIILATSSGATWAGMSAVFKVTP